MKFNTEHSIGNKQLKLISISPRMSFFLRIIFLLIVLSFTISFLSKKNVTLYTTLTFSLPRENTRLGKQFYNFTDFSESVDKAGNQLWESINPSFDCPKDLLLKVGGPKYGGGKDGGKWTCGINNLGNWPSTSLKNEQPCLVYSFGVFRDSSFEAEVLATTHCEVYAYDPSVDKIGEPLHPSNPRVHFKKLGISGEDSGDMRTLKSFMQENGGHKWIDILKMDVEYAEYPSLERILKDFRDEDGGLPFGQLLVEMHVKKSDDISATETVVSLFKRLEESGLRIFHNEINFRCGSNWCSELSFINTNEFSVERVLGN